MSQKNKKKCEVSLREFMGHNQMKEYMHYGNHRKSRELGSTGEREGEKRRESLFKEIMTKNQS